MRLSISTSIISRKKENRKVVHSATWTRFTGLSCRHDVQLTIKATCEFVILLSVLFVVASCFVYRLQKPHPLRSPVTKQPSLAKALTISSISENVNEPLVSKDCRNFSKAPLKLKFPLSSRGNYCYKLLLIACYKPHVVHLLSLLVRIPENNHCLANLKTSDN